MNFGKFHKKILLHFTDLYYKIDVYYYAPVNFIKHL